MTNVTRRGFLKKSMLATSGSMLVPQFLKAFEHAGQNNFVSSPDQDRILIIIQLSGGNDGLNTVVPYRNDRYYQLRPTLAIQPERVLRLNGELGFNPSLADLRDLFDHGDLSIINNVGYPNPDRSHFRSMDIWQTASRADEILSTGWIGRYLDSNCTGCGSHSAIEVDDTLSLAMRGESVKGMAIRDPAKLYHATQSLEFRKIADGHSDEPTVDYLYKTLAETASNAAYIYNKSKVITSRQSYPDNEFAKRLKTISELIQSGISTRVYYASLSGFDTHVRQAGQQERLLTMYSEAVGSLARDLKDSGNFDRTLIMTFSEFGRRVEENASGGTDHGTANNLFLVGGKLKTPGFYNHTPDLDKLDDGDLVHEIDFRQVYSTVIQKWLNADGAGIVGQSFPTLALI